MVTEGIEFSEDVGFLRKLNATMLLCGLVLSIAFYILLLRLGFHIIILQFFLFILVLGNVAAAFLTLFPFPWKYSLTLEGLEARRFFKFFIPYGEIEYVSSFRPENIRGLRWSRIFRKWPSDIYYFSSIHLGGLNLLQNHLYRYDLIVIGIKNVSSIKWPFSFTAFLNLGLPIIVLLTPEHSAAFRDELEKRSSLAQRASAPADK